MIMCGEIRVNGETIRDPHRKIDPNHNISLQYRKWVSRGGQKLDHALSVWEIDVNRKIVLDAGASTGGFTDCLLQRGAAFVHAVDVGYNQLDYRLRTDERVNVLERTNIMSVEKLDPAADIAVADLSFRSISGAAGHILGLTGDKMLIALIKPQFEIKNQDNFNGVIRNPEILKEVVDDTKSRLESEGLTVQSVIESPIKGQKGNTEYLFKLCLKSNI